MPGYVNADYEVDIELQDANGDAIDIDGYTFEMRWYRASDRKLVHTLTTGSGITEQAPSTDGVIRINLTAAQMTDLGAGMARVLIYRTDSGRKLIAEGSEQIEGVGYDA